MSIWRTFIRPYGLVCYLHNKFLEKYYDDPNMRMRQNSLFYVPQEVPEGFSYAPDFLMREEEEKLLEKLSKASLKNFIYQGYEAKRRIKSYSKESGYPSLLLAVMERAALFAGVSVEVMEHALVSEYSPGAAIGWHRDRGPYEKIIGISLGSAAPLRFRRRVGNKWERINVIAEPRSIYIMSGPSLTQWQHSIPPVTELRYSITMRTIERVIKF